MMLASMVSPERSRGVLHVVEASSGPWDLPLYVMEFAANRSIFDVDVGLDVNMVSASPQKQNPLRAAREHARGGLSSVFLLCIFFG